MKLTKYLLIAGALMTTATLTAAAQPTYYSPTYPYYQSPAQLPPSWYYNPYTSGLGPCPQRYPGDPPCSQTISPSYGQPDFWAR